MKRWINIVAQIALGLGQVANIAAPLLDEHEKAGAAVLIGMLQLVVSVIAHEYNPDGTDARTAYTKD